MIRKTEIALKGQTPLLMHRFPLEPVIGIEKKTPEEQAEIGAYRNGKMLYVPGVAVQRALIAAAAYSKGKGRASLQKQAAACFLVQPEYLDLGTDQYEIDSRAVVVPATKGRIVRHRPRLDEWQISLTLEWDDILLSEKQVRQIMDDMGSRVGLLDFRPACKGPYGRCIVTNWNTLPERD